MQLRLDEISAEISKKGSPWAYLLFACPVGDSSKVPYICEQKGDSDLSRRLLEDIKTGLNVVCADRHPDPGMERELLRAEIGPVARSVFSEISDLAFLDHSTFIMHGVAFIAGAWINDEGGYCHFVDIAGTEHNLKLVINNICLDNPEGTE